MKDKNGHIIINRDQCIYCSDFHHNRYSCPYRLWEGRPSDCPKLPKKVNE